MTAFRSHPASHTLTILRGTVHLSIADIVRLEGSGNYTQFILADGRKILTSKSIGFYEPLLPSTFLRVNKPFLLNRFYIKAFSKLEVEMNDGFVAPIARRKRGLMKNTAQY
jgi:DNA-binding LytR/AlgR family response regulator